MGYDVARCRVHWSVEMRFKILLATHKMTTSKATHFEPCPPKTAAEPAIINSRPVHRPLARETDPHPRMLKAARLHARPGWSTVPSNYIQRPMSAG